MVTVSGRTGRVEKRGMNCLDYPSSKNGFRGDETKEWLANHPQVERYAILDDGSDFHEDQPHFKATWDIVLGESTLLVRLLL